MCEHFDAQWLLHAPPATRLKISAFSPQSVFLCRVILGMRVISFLNRLAERSEYLYEHLI